MAANSTFDVGIDMDGVLYDFVTAWADEARRRGIGSIPDKPIARGWAFYRAWNITDEQFMDIFSGGVRSGRILWSGGVYTGTKEGWDAIRAGGHRIHILTDRKPVGAECAAAYATHHWLAEQGLIPDTLTITPNKTDILHLAADPKKVAFIEDKPENHAALTAAGVHAFLVNRPWNEDAPGARVPDLPAFAQIVNALTRR